MTIKKKKTAGIILAAGSGSRMGRIKQLLPFQGTTILGQVIDNASKSGLHELIVVLGCCADKITRAVDFSRTRIIVNPAYKKGHSNSLIKGIKNISSSCAGAMFLLGDQPLVSPAIINRLLEQFNRSTSPIIVPWYNQQRGNPVIVARSLFHRLETLTGDTGPRVIFNEFKNDILKVSILDKAILMDIDTIDDYEKLLSEFST